nr:hypothetical protein [uncultured Cellulosilyticum sp.]
MKREIIQSIVVLFTVVNGVIAAFSLGVTELIKYLLRDSAASMGMNVQVDEMMLGNISLTMGEMKNNLGWGFLALMFLGIIIIVAMHSNAHFHIGHK